MSTTLTRTIRLIVIIALTAASTTLLVGQPLPANVMAAGLGFQALSTPKMSGWLEIDKALPDVQIGGLTFHSYGGAATDYFGNSQSARIDTKIVFVQRAWFAAGSLQGAGAAFSSSGIGGSFVLGGWATMGIGRLLNIPGAILVFSGSWQKDDITTAVEGNPNLPTIFRTLGARGTYRFGVGKTW